MLTLRLALALVLVTACSPAQDTKPAEKPAASGDAPKTAGPAKPSPAPQPEPAKPEPDPQPAMDGTYALTPGESIGAVRIGMSKAEIEALGILSTHPQYSAMTIPISVDYDESEKAKNVEISLTHTDKDVSVGSVVIPKAANVDEIRELLGDCQAPVVNKGATVHACRAGAVIIQIGSGNPDEIWLRVSKP